MAYLFVDTSHLLHYGILDEKFNWIANEVVDTKKTSEILHEKIRAMLVENKLEISDLTALITIAGPGSYTGMRVGEGLAQIFELDGIDVFSFYSSDIPMILGDNEAHWAFPAFKKEYYIRTSDKEVLVSEGEFKSSYAEAVDNSHLYTHGVNEISDICLKNTRDLLIESPTLIFEAVVSGRYRKKPYYFRPLDVEFKKS